MKEIDNKKMWESLIWKVGEPLMQHIENALSEQGLTVNDNGEIVSIEPATEEEILKAKFDSPELPEIVKEQVREIIERPTVSWDSVNGTLRFDNLTIEQAEKMKNALIGEPNEKDGLTEFERYLWNITNLCEPDEKELSELKIEAKGLLSIARKQIASQLESKIGIYNTSFGYVEGIYTKEDMGKAQRQGYKDCIKAVKMGIIMDDSKKAIQNIKQALRQPATNGVPVGNMIEAMKEIEQKPVEWHREDEQNLNACLGFIPDEFLRRWLKDIIHVKYDKPAWSEED